MDVRSLTLNTNPTLHVQLTILPKLRKFVWRIDNTEYKFYRKIYLHVWCGVSTVLYGSLFKIHYMYKVCLKIIQKRKGNLALDQHTNFLLFRNCTGGTEFSPETEIDESSACKRFIYVLFHTKTLKFSISL